MLLLFLMKKVFVIILRFISIVMLIIGAMILGVICTIAMAGVLGGNSIRYEFLGVWKYLAGVFIVLVAIPGTILSFVKNPVINQQKTLENSGQNINIEKKRTPPAILVPSLFFSGLGLGVIIFIIFVFLIFWAIGSHGSF